jgi:hypothetical protein
VVRPDILVARNTPQHLEPTWEVTPAGPDQLADERLAVALLSVAQGGGCRAGAKQNWRGAVEY